MSLGVLRYEIKALLLLLLLLSIGLRTGTTLYSSADNLVEPTERTAAHTFSSVEQTLQQTNK